MKKIFFYGNINVYDKSSGITKKVLSQINALRDMGYMVYFTSYVEEGVVIFNNNNKVIKYDKYWTKNKKINRYLRRWKLLKSAHNFINETKEHFDYAYLRFHFFDRSYIRLLKQLKTQNAKVIIEAHSYPYRSKKLNSLTPTHIVDFLYETHAKKYIDLVAAISNYKNIWGCKTISIDNAINLNEIKLKKIEIRMII